MPIIEYEDEKTGEVFERFFKNHNIPDSVVNEKTGNNSIKKISSGSFKLIGSGFYANEYPKK
ncbi:MAG: hypothetical protein M0R17_03920 [Candidatus Omnitrophica bacterium]|jgi:predicted nucleic acid-binding Zn ribbon protein|nr:hypothetical protein [Candidatus Omnitrophota bacterium]